jgi:hypothetical protein
LFSKVPLLPNHSGAAIENVWIGNVSPVELHPSGEIIGFELNLDPVFGSANLRTPYAP